MASKKNPLSLFDSFFIIIPLFLSLLSFRHIESIVQNGPLQKNLQLLGFQLSFFVDPLALLFSLVICVIGFGISLYSHFYFGPTYDRSKFQALMLGFTLSMLGLVTSANLIWIFIFWELTTLISYFLISFSKNETAFSGARTSLIVTGLGGFALLGAFQLLAKYSGSYDLVPFLSLQVNIREAPEYALILFLFLVAVFSKSALFPFQFWLPKAMAAPTPASAYLHSATMVKAGLFLAARFSIVLGETSLWTQSLLYFGVIGYFLSALKAPHKDDLKGLLAQTTLGQLSFLAICLALAPKYGAAAFVCGFLGHAFYKAGLFLAAGAIEKQAGTRLQSELSQTKIQNKNFFKFAFAAGAFSLAALPPSLLYISKELVIESLAELNLFEKLGFGTLFIVGTIRFAWTAAVLGFGSFLNGTDAPPKKPNLKTEHSMSIRVLLTLSILLSLVAFFLPSLSFFGRGIEELLTLASRFNSLAPEVSLKLFHGLNLSFFISILIFLGAYFIYKNPPKPLHSKFYFDFENFEKRIFKFFEKTSLYFQHGKTRLYLLSMLGTALFFVFQLCPELFTKTYLNIYSNSNAHLSQALALILALVPAGLILVFKNDFFSIIAFGMTGLGVSLFFALEPAPDVALVMIIVDVLSVFLFCLALRYVSRSDFIKFSELQKHLRSRHWIQKLLNYIIPIGIGFLFFIFSLANLNSRGRPSLVSPYYILNALPLAGTHDIVGAVITDFRGFDTVIEISVFFIAGLVLRALLVKRFSTLPLPLRLNSKMSGVASSPFSAMIRYTFYFSAFILMILALQQLFLGHEEPGDGFSAAVLSSCAIALLFSALGLNKTRMLFKILHIRWITLIGFASLALAFGLSFFERGYFLAPLAIGSSLKFILPENIHFSTSWLFELAIFLSVFASSLGMIQALLGERKGQDLV